MESSEVSGTTSKKILHTGTTTVGIVCKNAVILASDQRATMGYLIASKHIEKVHPIADNIGMTVAGSVGDAQSLIRLMRAEIKLYELRNGKKMSVKAAATLLANILSNYKFYPFFVQLLVGGYDTKPHLYSIDMAGGITEEKIAATGSGSPVAYGVLENRVKSEDTSENIKIAIDAINAAMQRDAATGERADVVVIDKNGFRRLSKEEVKLIGEGKKIYKSSSEEKTRSKTRTHHPKSKKRNKK